MYYALKENAYKEMEGLGKGNLTELKDVFLIDDNLNVRYISKDGKIYGDEIEEKILENDTKIRFSSKAFSEYISKKLGIEEDKMTFGLMEKQTSLTISDPNVNSLQDLVFFPNLTSLILGDNSGYPPITTLDGIENCTKLESISILYGINKDYTAIRALKNLTRFMRIGGSDFDNIIDALKSSTSLENLEITRNEITSMKRIAEIRDLKSLALNNNKITKIEGLENKPSLRILYLSNNKIAKIEGLESLLNLKYLYLNNNQITDITPLSINSSLTSLDLRKNTGIEGNKDNYTGEKLEALNKIGEILDRNGSINIDVDKLGLFTNYKKLDLSSQNITSLKPLKGLNQLTSLNLSNNKITLGEEDKESEDILKSMTNLTELSLYNNHIKDVTAINSLTNLKNLDLRGNENNIDLKKIEDIISNLSTLKVSTESLKTIVNCDVNKITMLNLPDSNITEIPDISNFVKLIRLNLNNNNNITNLNMVSNLSNLQELYLENINLHGRMIGFTKLKKLNNLNLSKNTLWDEDLENLKALKDRENLTINFSNNSIREATALLELNPNTKINLSGNVNLTENAKTKLRNHFRTNVTF